MRNCLLALLCAVTINAVAQDWSNFAKAALPGAEVKGQPFARTSLQLNGSSQYLTYEGRVVASYPFTMSAWIKTSSMAEQAVLGIYDSTTESRFWRLRLREGKLYLDVSNNRLLSISTPHEIADGHWHFVVAVFPTSRSRDLYVDGKHIVSSNASVNFSTNGATFAIGRTGDASPHFYFKGKIDEVAIWDSALPASAISTLYNSGKPVRLNARTGNYVQSTSLVSWWRMGDSGLDNLRLTIKDVKGTRDLRPFGLSSDNVTGDVP